MVAPFIPCDPDYRLSRAHDLRAGTVRADRDNKIVKGIPCTGKIICHLPTDIPIRWTQNRGIIIYQQEGTSSLGSIIGRNPVQRYPTILA